MDNEKIRLAASVLSDGIERITGKEYSGKSALPEQLGQISEAAYSIVGNDSTASEKICQSIFNILNGASKHCGYKAAVLSENEINYPADAPSAELSELREKAAEAFNKSTEISPQKADSLNSLLGLIENYGSYIPSGNYNDISVYDYTKLSAALSLCVFDWLSENREWESKLRSDAFPVQKAFMIFSADISGIQSFIYNISSKSALKGLRARSFWLELMLENIIDELLERLELLRCNIMYTGGGHAYLILPATEKVRKTIGCFTKELNHWFEDNFGTDLYIGCGYCECSANELNNRPKGSYRRIFREVSNMISRSKINRYSAAEIIRMNSQKSGDSERECVICRRSDKLRTVNGMCCCSICSGLLALSDSITSKDSGGYFTVLSEKPENTASVILPFDRYLISDSREGLKSRIGSGTYLRSYGKNHGDTELHTTRLWVGDYCAEKELAKLSESSTGIDRLAVFRADIDNLGQAFVNGFDDAHVNIMRTSEFSSKLSLFFKHDINSILEKPQFSLDGRTGGRNAVIIYSGGDDVFAVGSWNDIIGFAVDLQQALSKFSLNTLTISAGIGLYPAEYPIYEMASETGRLEDASKNNPGKNSITLFSDENCYSWDEFSKKVIGEKYRTIRRFLDNNSEKGKAMLYNMLELIRNRSSENRLNIARFAYLLARVRPADEKSPDFKEKLERFSDFKKQMYSWIQNETDARQLITSIYLFVYTERERTDNNER